MVLHAKNGTIPVGDTEMDYITFGRGEKTLVILPGLSDGLTSVKGKALFFALSYKAYTKDYTVYVFSRKNKINSGYTMRDIAKDQADAMKKLGITKADVMGISQGGMISQYLAIDYPHLINKLILTVSSSKQNETIQKTVSHWIELAKRGDYKNLLVDTAKNSYTEKQFKKNRYMYPIIAKFTKPKDFNKFLIQAKACINHNSYDELHKITCPTLVIGGDNDKVVGTTSSIEIAEKIPNSELHIYKGLGHSAFEEAKDYKDRVLHFLRK